MDQTLDYRQLSSSFDYRPPITAQQPIGAMHRSDTTYGTVIIEDDYEPGLNRFDTLLQDGQITDAPINAIYRQSEAIDSGTANNNIQHYQCQNQSNFDDQPIETAIGQQTTADSTISAGFGNQWMTSNTTVEDIELALNQISLSSNSNHNNTNNDGATNTADEEYHHRHNHFHRQNANNFEIDPDSLSPGGLGDDQVLVNQLPIHYAASQNCLELMKQLTLEDKQDIDLRDFESNTPLILAALNGHVEMVRYLVENGANLNAQNIFDNSAVHEASWRGYSQSLEILCRNKAKLHLKNKQGHTALHLAAQKGHNQSCRIILLSGCKPNIKNNFGDTPLHSASRYGHIGMVRILISAFANVNELNKNDDTALHIAAAMGRKKLAKILLESGCNPTIINKQGETPMNIALRKSFFEIQEVIANPPTLKPIYLKQQELYVRPLQGSFKDIYSALPRSESYSSTNQQFEPSHRAQQGTHLNTGRNNARHHQHHSHRKSADYPKRCKSDFSNGYLNGISATAQSTSEKQGAISVSKYYSSMLLREASPYEPEPNKESGDNESLENDGIPATSRKARPLQHESKTKGHHNHNHRSGQRNHRSRDRDRDRDYHHKFSDFPKPKLETLPREPLAKGEQYYVDLSGHIYKGPIKRSSSASNHHSKSHSTDSNKSSKNQQQLRSANHSHNTNSRTKNVV